MFIYSQVSFEYLPIYVNLLIKPTRLSIKQCPHCGLLYFCKTVCENIEKYSGSGVIWIRHLKKHNVKPITLLISEWFFEKDKIIETAKTFSIQNNIVDSSLWANLKIEDGIDGGNLTEEIKQKISKTLTGRKIPEHIVKKSLQNKNYKTHSIETKNKISLSMKGNLKAINSHIGKKHSEETKAKISITLKNKQR